jgi:hypothetical protein
MTYDYPLVAIVGAPITIHAPIVCVHPVTMIRAPTTASSSVHHPVCARALITIRLHLCAIVCTRRYPCTHNRIIVTTVHEPIIVDAHPPSFAHPSSSPSLVHQSPCAPVTCRRPFTHHLYIHTRLCIHSRLCTSVYLSSLVHQSPSMHPSPITHHPLCTYRLCTFHLHPCTCCLRTH